LLDNNKLIARNTTVRPDPNRPKDNLGLTTGFLRASTFGTATGGVRGERRIPQLTIAGANQAAAREVKRQVPVLEKSVIVETPFAGFEEEASRRGRDAHAH
jgi:hypothetical protein